MANRYRGRGRGGYNSRTKQENAIAIQPLPLYPSLINNPLPLPDDPELDHLLKFKRDYRKVLQESEYYFKNNEVKKDIERYSDKYNSANVSEWHPDFANIPKELKIGKLKKEKTSLKKPKTGDIKSVEMLFNNLEENEAKEIDKVDQDDNEENKKPQGDGEDEEEDNEEEEEEDEEDYLEDNDYVANYFDDGEDNDNMSDNNNEEY